MKKIGLLPRLIIAIILGIAIGAFLPKPAVQTLATFNQVFGSFLGFVIPLIIIGFVAPGIGELGAGAGKILGITAAIAYLSTIFSASFAFFVDKALFPNFLKAGSLAFNAANPEESLVSGFITIEMPPIMGVTSALIIAFILGLGMAAIKGGVMQKFMSEFQQIVEKLIGNVIIPLLPIHIMGIFANMTFAGQVATIISVFAKVFAIIIALHLIVIVMQYVFAGAVAGANPVQLIKTMLPAYMTAIGTQSSAATIPVTLAQTKKNGIQQGVAEFVIPLCATIHLSGSTITLVSCAIAVMMLHGMPVDFLNMLPFILMLGVTMVAAPGVPGGAVMAALGILKSMLGFDDNLLSLMIALYIAQDSFGTACNVTGDGAIAVMVNKISGHTINHPKTETL